MEARDTPRDSLLIERIEMASHSGEGLVAVYGALASNTLIALAKFAPNHISEVAVREHKFATVICWHQLHRGAPKEEYLQMCDYSLHDVASRPARVEDKLVTTSFHNSITRGFAAADNPGVAICLLPGTEIAFENDVECDQALSWLVSRLGLDKIGEKVARFRKVNEEHHHAHHDALEFPSGKIVMVTTLREGQRATVLQLPASQRAMLPDRQTDSSLA